MMIFIGDTTSIVRTELESPKFARKLYIYHGNPCMQTQQGVVKGYAQGVCNMQPQTPPETTGHTKDTEHKFGAHEAPRNMWSLFC